MICDLEKSMWRFRIQKFCWSKDLHSPQSLQKNSARDRKTLNNYHFCEEFVQRAVFVKSNMIETHLVLKRNKISIPSEIKQINNCINLIIFWGHLNRIVFRPSTKISTSFLLKTCLDWLSDSNDGSLSPKAEFDLKFSVKDGFKIPNSFQHTKHKCMLKNKIGNKIGKTFGFDCAAFVISRINKTNSNNFCFDGFLSQKLHNKKGNTGSLSMENSDIKLTCSFIMEKWNGWT